MANNPANTIDVNAIDQEIEKLRMLKALAEDPKFAARLSQFVVDGRNGAHVSNGVAPTSRASAIAAPVRHKGQGRGKRHPRGVVRAKVLEAMIALGQDGKEVTTKDIHAHATQSGFRFKARNENVAINDALRSLEQDGKVKINPSGKTDQQRNVWVLVGNHDAPSGIPAPRLINMVPSETARAQTFLKTHGPASRLEIIENTGIQPGSFSHFVKKRTNLFRQRPDEKWELVG